MNKEELESIVKALVVPGKGILATDATDSTMNKRLEKVGIEATPENRREFREILLTRKGYGDFISGVILNDEIIRQKTKDGKGFAKLVEDSGAIPGIKVDKKTHDMANFPGEKIIEGLDGLRDRLVEYKGMGAKFTKFRAVITIGEGLPAQAGIPTETCINSNSESLARFAALSQEQDMVPIIEPEVIRDGEHDINSCMQATLRTLKSVFKHLSDHKVFLKGVLLKPNMVTAGKDCPQKVSSQEVAQKTIEVLKQVLPNEIGGVVFLSGGQSPEEATENLNAINKIGGPWSLSFSFERALEDIAMTAWKKDHSNIQAVQEAFYQRAKLNSLARQGKYLPDMEEDLNG